jgi:hypothetical protein
MKNIVIILLLAFGMRAQEMDKTKHFYAGFGITMISGSIIHHYTDKPTLVCLGGIGIGMLSGLSKEYIWDRKMGKGVFSKEDYLMTGWGAICSGLVLRCIIDIKERRSVKKNLV